MGRHVGDFPAGKADRPPIGPGEAAEEVEQVVLPAPFGPMSAVIEPRSTLELGAVDGAQAIE